MILIFATSILRRAHGSKFFGLIENANFKRAVITSALTVSCAVWAEVYNLYLLCMIPLFWFWLAPGTHIGAVDGDKKEMWLAMLRETYAMPVMYFYAWYSGNPWLSLLCLLCPLQGFSYYLMRNQRGDKVAKAEFLLGAFMGLLLTVVGYAGTS